MNAVVKRAKAGEKAYICLKSAWVLRGYRESLQESGDYDRNFTDQLERQEEEFLENAYKGFSEARQSEMLPICGMNGITVDYLVAVLAMRFKDYNVAIKLLSVVITSSGTSPRIKDRARDMKDQIQRELKKQ